MKISAVVPVKNGEKFIEASIENLLINTTKNDEVIYIDDNSSDATLQTLLDYKKKIDRLKIFKNRGFGLVDALNYGISKASNTWIARFDVDDICTPNRIKEQRQLFSNDVAAIFCDYEFVDEKMNSLGKILSPVLPSATLISLINSQRTAHSGVIFSKKYFTEVGGYRKADFPVEDLSLWLRMGEKGKLISVPENLLFYRLHQDSVTANNRQIIDAKRAKIIDSYINLIFTVDISKADEIWKTYKQLPNPNERQILFFRDYLTLLNNKSANWEKIVFQFKYYPRIFFNIKNIFILLKLYRQRRVRTKYRNGYLKKL